MVNIEKRTKEDQNKGKRDRKHTLWSAKTGSWLWEFNHRSQHLGDCAACWLYFLLSCATSVTVAQPAPLPCCPPTPSPHVACDAFICRDRLGPVVFVDNPHPPLSLQNTKNTIESIAPPSLDPPTCWSRHFVWHPLCVCGPKHVLGGFESVSDR